MEIKADLVKELRQRTGIGMMECKAALKEAGGDLEEALNELILDRRLLVLFELQLGHSGLSILGSEKRTSLSNSEPQLEQMYSYIGII